MMKKFFLFLLISLLYASFCSADALIVVKAMTADTIAEIFIEEDRVRLELEIGMKDIPAFKNILPDDIYEKMGDAPLAFEHRLKQFLESGFIFQADGKQLGGNLVAIGPRKRIKRDQITGELLPIEEEKAETVVNAVFEYPFEGKPNILTMRPPANKGGFTNANIGFVVYHLGLAVNDFRYLSRQEALDLDWEDPWYSQFQRRTLWRRYKEPFSAFIYVDPFEVRKEIILRPKDLQAWVDLGLEGKDIIKAEDYEDIKRKIAVFFENRQAVVVDGERPVPLLDRVHFIRRTLRMTSVIDPPEDLPIHSAMVGVIFVYPRTGLPQEVAMEWDLFNDKIQKVNAVTTDEAGGLPYPLEPDDRVLRWTNFLKSPTIPSLVDLKPPSETVMARIPLLGFDNPFAKYQKIKNEDTQAILLGLLRNIYHAFDYRKEDETYDVLAKSAVGDLLTQIYLEARRSLELKNQGGAKVKIKEVTIVSNETENLKDEIGFKARCTWNASGTVGHWGHIHTRKNQYEAMLTVKAIDGTWKITGLEMLNEERL